MKTILIVDDDAHLRALVKTYAEIDGYQCIEAENSHQALDIAETTHLDMIVLDVMMPGKDGFETLAELRKFTQTPVIMLTARKEEYDKLFGFNLGADDYLAKPFSPKELMARIKAIQKRGMLSNEGPLRFGELEIKEHAHIVLIDGQEVSLTPKEFDLLLLFAKNVNIVFTRDNLLKNIWGYDYFGDIRTVDTHVKSLRERLGTYRNLIKTVWGIGYKFEYREYI